MQIDIDLLENYFGNEEIYSNQTDANTGTTAWRQQAIILQHISRNFPAAAERTILGDHLNKLKPQLHADFLQQRASEVDQLLKGHKRAPKVNGSLCDNDVDALIEGPCRGVFESCRHTEMTNSRLENINGGLKDTAALALNVTNVTTFTDSKALPHTKPKNTLSAYLQRELAPSTKAGHTNEAQQVVADAISPAENIVRNDFRTANEMLIAQNVKKYGADINERSGSVAVASNTPLFNYGTSKKSLGARRDVRSKFVPPIRGDDGVANAGMITARASPTTSAPGTPTCTPPDAVAVDERLANIEPKMIELITNEIMHKQKQIEWSDIAGLEYSKSIIKEAVVYPMLRPDIFTGLRRPPRGILLFGPPGTGKTLIGKCIASQSQSTFFSISASSLTSKWIGDGEKMVRTLFAVALVHQPSVIFIDEIDSLLSQRSETEHESSRRLKTEFLVQLDGAATSEEDRILIVGATNRPQELDEAARRRLVRRLYIPLPDLQARRQILENLLRTVHNNMNEEHILEIAKLSDGYSGADMESLCREASMEPIRSIPASEIPFFSVGNVRPVAKDDFNVALKTVRPSVSQADLQQYLEWNKIYGAGR